MWSILECLAAHTVPSLLTAVHRCLWIPEPLVQWAAFWSTQELVWKNRQAMAPLGSLTRLLAKLEPAGRATPLALEALPQLPRFPLPAPGHENTAPIQTRLQSSLQYYASTCSPPRLEGLVGLDGRLELHRHLPLAARGDAGVPGLVQRPEKNHDCLKQSSQQKPKIQGHQEVPKPQTHLS